MSKDGRKTGTFREMTHSNNSTKKVSQQPQVFLGMVDSEENFRPRYEASPIRQQHLSLPAKQDRS